MMAQAQALDPQSDQITRLLSPGLEAALEQFANPLVLAEGKVNVLALDAIVERFGGRWAMRRDSVHEHVQATLDRQLGSRGYHLRISDTDILVCQPDLGRLMGQASCLRLLREVLSHFLGEGAAADVGVHEALSVTPQGVQARRVDPAAAFAAEAQIDRFGAERPPSTAGAGPGLGAVDQWTPFVDSNGRRVKVSTGLENVAELRGNASIGLRFARRISDLGSARDLPASELALLSRSDRLRIDLGGMVSGLNALRAGPGAAKPPSIIVPISFSSLSNLEGRAQIVSGFKEARGYCDRGVICELCEIDGVPAATLIAAVAMIRPFSLFVVGHVEDLRTGEGRALKEAGIRAVSIDCPGNLGDTAFAGWARPTIATARKVAKSVLLYGVPSEHQVRMAAGLGATHASISQACESAARPRERAW